MARFFFSLFFWGGAISCVRRRRSGMLCMCMCMFFHCYFIFHHFLFWSIFPFVFSPLFSHIFIFSMFLFFVRSVRLTFYQYSSCTAQVVRTLANAVTSALGQVFSKRVIHGIESQHSFNLVAERWLALSKQTRSLPRIS